LITNEIDQSFSANVDFGAVANPFALAGVIGNYNELMNTSGTLAKFSAGYYQNGALPFSLYVSGSGSGLSNYSGTGFSHAGLTTVSVTSGSTTTSYDWYSLDTSTSYSLPSGISSLDATFQGLFKISGITTGLNFNINPNNSSTAGDQTYYTTTTSTHYYNTAAAASVPNRATDYVNTVVRKNLTADPGVWGSGQNTTTSSTQFYIPVALKTGNLEHSAYAGVKLYGSDSSASLSNTTTSATQTVLGTITDTSVDITNTSNTTTIDVGYTLSMPGFVGAANGNKFSAGLAVSDAIGSAAYSYTSTSKLYTAGAVNTKTAAGGGTTVGSATYSSVNAPTVTVMALHSFKFAPESASLVIQPQVVAQYKYTPNGGSAIAASATEYTQTLNASFAYDGSAYTKTTYTTTGTPSSVGVLDIGINLPTAFKFKPAAWPFGVLAGSDLYSEFKTTTTTTSGETQTTTDQNYTGTTLTSTTVSSTTNTATTQVTFAPSFGEKHYFGIFIPLGGDIRADISLNGSNLLVFDSLSVQLYVPLK